MTSFIYKGLTRNPEILHIHAWVLLNIWRLRQVKDTKFGKKVSNKTLLNAVKWQGHSFTVSELLREIQQGGGGVK